MNDVIEKLEKLSVTNDSITLYKPLDLKNLYKGVGRTIGEFNKELLELLKITNGASILDYCLLGFKNNKLGTDIDKLVYELWSSNDNLAGTFIGFMLDNIGGTFGYLIGSEFEKLNYKPIGYSNPEEPEILYIIGSSFRNFFLNFLDDVKYTIESNDSTELLVNIEIENWPLDIDHWVQKDPELNKVFLEMGLKNEGILEL